MAVYKLIIPQKLPALNEYVNANRKNWRAGARLKKETEKMICIQIKKQLTNVKIKKQIQVIYSWYEPNKKRDKDNIAFAKKFINDALVKMEVLKNDGWVYVDGFKDLFYLDKLNGRVEVEIEEVG